MAIRRLCWLLSLLLLSPPLLAARDAAKVAMLELSLIGTAELNEDDGDGAQARAVLGVGPHTFSWLEYRDYDLESGFEVQEAEAGLAAYLNPNEIVTLYAGIGAAYGDYSALPDQQNGGVAQLGFSAYPGGRVQLSLEGKGIWLDDIDYRSGRVQLSLRMASYLRLLLEYESGRYESDAGVSDLQLAKVGLRLNF